MNNDKMVNVPFKALRDFLEHSACTYKGPEWTKNKAALRHAMSAPVERDEQALFEEWHKSVVEGEPPHEKYNSGDYRNQHVQRYWLGWKSRAELESKP